jgi:hypothetical protein
MEVEVLHKLSSNEGDILVVEEINLQMTYEKHVLQLFDYPLKGNKQD